MDYNTFKEQITDYLTHNLSEEELKVFNDFLVNNPQYQSDIDEAEFLWNNFENETPEPSQAMDDTFYNLLTSETEKLDVKDETSFLSKLFSNNWSKQLAFGLAVLTIGFFAGQFFNQPDDTVIEKDVQIVNNEVENVRSQLVLTLLDQPSANKRLQAVSEVNKLNNVTETIINALFTTLNNDTNVNVRLSAVEALANYSDIPKVREGLIASIAKQESPLVQMALADLMVLLQEKRAVQPLKQLIEKDNINENAKEKMEESIDHLI